MQTGNFRFSIKQYQSCHNLYCHVHQKRIIVTIEQKIASLFQMDDETWARHANPWSVWTRTTTLLLLIVAFWSRTWLGMWSLVPIACAIIWTWINPRLFKKPESTDNWASMAVLGERVWLNRKEIPLPKYHRLAPNILSSLSGIGALFVIWGVYTLDIWPTLFGAAIIYLSKLWFLDRMVWIYRDMKDATPEYASWLYDTNRE